MSERTPGAGRARADEAEEILRARADRITRLTAAAAGLAEAATLEDVAAGVLEKVLPALGARGGMLCLPSGPGELAVAWASGPLADRPRVLRTFRTGAAVPVADAFRTGKPVFAGSRHEIEERWPDMAHLAEAVGDAAWAAWPLLSGGHPVGALGLEFDAPQAFDGEQRLWLGWAADRCAAAIDRARAHDAERAALEAARGSEARAREVLEVHQRLMQLVGHDIRTPLAAMTMSVDTLLAAPGLGESERRVLVRVGASGARIAAIVRDLLDYGQLRFGRGLAVSRRTCRVEEACARALREVQAQFPGRLVEVSFDEPGEGLWDPERLAQCLESVLAFAVQVGPRSSPVRLRAQGTPDALRVRVSAAGTWDAAALARVFDPFDAPVRGTAGLGLHLAREIARAHGGEIGASSADGEGVSLVLTLPRDGE
jgi:K+-sensing histidine kinase KdpD